MRQQEDVLEKLDVRVKIVTFDADYMARTYVSESGLKWPLLLDGKRTLYAAYGMQRAGWWSLYGPVSIWKYIKLIASGTKPGKPGRDWHQLGGDVLIDPNGIVRVHHMSTGPHDRPTVESLLEAVRL